MGLHPILAMGAECSIFSFLGSFLCQLFLSKPGKNWDFMNMIIVMTYSAFCFAPTAFYWYPLIESMFPGSDAKSLCIKVVMDQIIYSPVLLSWFWFHSTFLSTMDINQSIAAIPKNVMASLISSWCYWPL